MAVSLLCVFMLTAVMTPLSSGQADIDWRGEFMAPVRDIKGCGGAVVPFSVLAALEWHVGQITGQLIPLSVQYLIDCGVNDRSGERINRCQGDGVAAVIRQVMREQYIPYQSDYGYLSNFAAGRCELSGAKDMRNALADVWVHGFEPIGQTPEAIRAALQNGPIIDTLNVGSMFHEASNKIQTDDECVKDPERIVATFVGWQSNNGNPYYIVRGVDGEDVGKDGYFKYADNRENERCGYTRQAYSLRVGPRKEVEYQLGVGRLNFREARGWCREQLGSGWDLAHIPTEMHDLQVYDMFTEKFGSEKSRDDSFNVFWIGLFDTRSGDDPGAKSWSWVNGRWNVPMTEITGTEIKFSRFGGNDKYRFGAMRKVNRGEESFRGAWTTRRGVEKLRFVCGRYRSEECPRISSNFVRNARRVEFFSPAGESSLEIVDGTTARVECMEGFTLSGGEGLCQSGQWTNLPTCEL